MRDNILPMYDLCPVSTKKGMMKLAVYFSHVLFLFNEKTLGARKHIVVANYKPWKILESF